MGLFEWISTILAIVTILLQAIDTFTRTKQP
jgi:hypothetical protein